MFTQVLKCRRRSSLLKQNVLHRRVGANDLRKRSCRALVLIIQLYSLEYKELAKRVKISPCIYDSNDRFNRFSVVLL